MGIILEEPKITFLCISIVGNNAFSDKDFHHTSNSKIEFGHMPNKWVRLIELGWMIHLVDG